MIERAQRVASFEPEREPLRGREDGIGDPLGAIASLPKTKVLPAFRHQRQALQFAADAIPEPRSKTGMSVSFLKF
jgi:hypothetical protein